MMSAVGWGRGDSELCGGFWLVQIWLEGRSLDPGSQGRAHSEGKCLHQPVCVWTEGHILRPSCADQAKFQEGGAWAQAQQAGFGSP